MSPEFYKPTTEVSAEQNVLRYEKSQNCDSPNLYWKTTKRDPPLKLKSKLRHGIKQKERAQATQDDGEE